jgi:hypothetical protein
MSKVNLPKEVAEAIESFRSQGWADYLLVSCTFDYTQRPHQVVAREVAVLRKHFASICDEKKLLSALVNGYGIEEKSPEEAVRDYYDKLHGQVYNGSFAPVVAKSAELSGLLQTLDLLGKKIIGVNG